MSGSGGWRAWAPAVLLLAVAGLQITLTRTVGLTAWKGGGFGMFAASDGGAARTVGIVLERDGRGEVLDLPASLEVDAARAAAFPAAVMLARLADRVVARERRQGRAVERITVEVWSAALAGDGSGAEAVRLAHHAQDVAPDGPR